MEAVGGTTMSYSASAIAGKTYAEGSAVTMVSGMTIMRGAVASYFGSRGTASSAE